MTRATAFALGTLWGGWPGGVLGVGALDAARWLIRRRRPPADRVDALAVAARLLVLVGAGLPLVPALAAAGSGQVPEIETVVRRWRRLGAAAALSSATGELAPLLHRLGAAASSGAAAEPAIRAYIEAERRRRHTEMIERTRRLPVRMMIPTTLLILPGFILMVYGPAFVGLVTDLLGPLAG